jgi:hypothetical protein
LGHALSLRYTRIPDLQRRWQDRQNHDHWPTAYHPGTNSLYVPYIENCLDMAAAAPGHPERRVGKFRPGGDPNKITGLVKINLETGEMMYFNQGRAPTNGAVGHSYSMTNP